MTEQSCVRYCFRDNAAEEEVMTWVGQSIERVEDAALLTGRGRYIDDLGVPPAPCTRRCCARRIRMP